MHESFPGAESLLIDICLSAECAALLGTTMNIMHQFNKNSESYQRIRRKICYPESLYEYLNSLISTAKNSKNSALDIGCGNGVSTARLKPYFDEVVGTDIGENLIAHASKSYPDIKFYCQPAERLSLVGKFSLVTAATCFYWMDRKKVLTNLAPHISEGGIFCAYKYDFPIVYGALRNFIEGELCSKWSKYRDPRIENYDNTKEIIDETNLFSSCERSVIGNIITLSPLDVAYFFLSTSYVTKYMESEDKNYEKEFVSNILSIEKNDIKINFDIHCFIAKK
jgi:SAM-dependent methyltransferase